MSPALPSFELERFSVTPVTDATVLLEVEGRLGGLPPRSAEPKLLVEGARRTRREHAALEAMAEDERLRATFVVPAADAETAGFALAVGGLLLELPAPDPTPGADRTVALARELNGARRQLARYRARIEADAEAARGHAAELATVREEGEVRARELAAEAEAEARAAEERAAAAEAEAAERVRDAEEHAAERVATVEREGGARESALEVAASQLEGVLADVRAGAEQREAAAAEQRRELEAELRLAREEAAGARAAEAQAAGRAQEAEAEVRALRSELETRQRALDASAAELSRSPDRRARAVGRPRTVAGVAPTEEHAPAGEPDGPGRNEAAAPVPAETEALLLDEDATVAVGAEAFDGDPDRDADAAAIGDRDADANGDRDRDADPNPDPDPDPEAEAEAEAEASGTEDTVAAVADEEPGDPVPDDGRADPTVTHDAVPGPPPEPEPPEDTGPIPLRRGSERRYVPRSDRDEDIGGEGIRVLGRDRPRASALPPPPDADPGPPVGPTPRTLVLAVFALAALLLFVVLLL